MGAQLAGSGGRRGGIVGINVTPMVDVVLVLLVIMMVSATYIASQSIKVELPKSASSDESVSSPATVQISKDGKFFFNQETIAIADAELAGKLREARAANADLNLIISGDTNAHHGDVVHVIDVAKREGVTKFAITIDQQK
jgi:biopolymer transport protein ExbD